MFQEQKRFLDNYPLLHSANMKLVHYKLRKNSVKLYTVFKILTNTIMKKMLKYPKLVGWNFNLDPRSGETKRTFLLSNNTRSVVLFEF